jgi:hypothetical protein
VGVFAGASRTPHRRPQRLPVSPSGKQAVAHGRGFWVQVIRAFERTGEVFSTEAPTGKVATALHIGPYERLGDTHKAIRGWAAANQISFAGKSREIYGDWTEDAAKLETRIEYLLT